MKKLILLLALMGFVFTSCENGSDIEENNGTTPSIPQIELAQQIVEVEFEPSEYAVSVTSPYSWEAKSKNDWLILKTESGIGGTKDLKFSVKRNEEEEVREGTIAIQNEDRDLYVELYVSQKPFVPAISLSSEALQYEFAGGTQEVIITSNFEYEVTKNCDWLSYEQTEKGLNLTVAASTITEVRSTEIVVANEKYNITKKITIEQKPFEPIIELDRTEVVIDVAGGSVDVMFVANAEYQVSCKEEWVSLSDFEDEQGAKGVKITASASTITEDRVAEVIISLPGYDVSKTIKVTQKAFEPSLELDVTELEFEAEGGYKYVTVTANSTFSVSEDASWITYTKSGNSVKITATSSTITEERSAEVTIFMSDYGVSKVVKVTQKAFVPSLELDVTELEFEADGGYKYVYITANTTFSISEDASWITYTKYSNSVRITASSSTITEERSADITIYLPNYDISKVVKVTQRAFVPTLSIDVSEMSFDADGGSKYAYITTNATYSVSIDADWVAYTKSSNRVTITAAASTVAEERNANVTITLPNYGINKVIKVTQKAFEPILSVEDISTLEFDYNGGERIISVTSNFDYSIDCSAEWVVYEKSANGIKLTIAPNYVMKARSTILTISGAKYNLANKIISITQTTMPTDYTVIEYTTDFGGIVTPYNTNAFGDAQIVSNTYENGKGTLKFSKPLTTIGSQAFYNSLLTSIAIPNSVTSIGNNAFYGCNSLTSVIIPNSVTSIGNNAFYGCNSLTSVHINNLSSWCKINFDSIEAQPIHNDANLYLNGELVTELIVPSDVSAIGGYAFYNCSSLTSVKVGDNVTMLGSATFSHCVNLTNVIIGNNVTSIGASAFSYCANLTNITIGKSVTVVDAYAFYNCAALRTVTIPECITTIGTSAFNNCSSLKNVYCKSLTPPAIRDSPSIYCSFSMNSQLKIYVPRNSYNSYMQYTYSSASGSTAVENWYAYKSYIEPYDF